MVENLEKKAYISALGVMGRNHLLALIKEGYEVYTLGLDVNDMSHAVQLLQDNNLNNNNLIIGQFEKIDFDVAIFCETAPGRFKNFYDFTNQFHANKYLLEKPLSNNSGDLEEYILVCKNKNILNKVFVNYSRRGRGYLIELQKICKQENNLSMTINAGAIAFGCNGVHFFFIFLWFTRQSISQVIWAEFSDEKVLSGRGSQYEDFGVRFLLKNQNGVLYTSLTADSSAGVVISLTGEDFFAYIDEVNNYWSISKKCNDSNKPKYRYGADYKVYKSGVISLPSMENLTRDWLNNKLKMPSITDAMLSHELLFKILNKCHAPKPYKFN